MPLANPGQGGVADARGPEDWFKSLPFITRYWFGATLIVTLSVNFEIIHGSNIAFIWSFIKQRFELWRFITCFLYAGPFSFNTLISCYMLVQFSQKYESGGPFNTGAGGGTADYAFCILFGMVSMLLTYPISPIPIAPIFSHNLIHYVLYVWSKRNPTAQANIWGFPVAAIYLPFAYLALSVFMGSPYMDMIHGMAIGHIYYFLVDVVPVVYGKDILQTPNFLIDYFGIGEYTPAAPAPAPQRFGGGGGGAAPRAGGHNWGTGGRALGRD